MDLDFRRHFARTVLLALLCSTAVQADTTDNLARRLLALARKKLAE